MIIASSIQNFVPSLETREGEIFYTVFIILISLGGLIALYFFIRSIQTARNSNNWPSVVGEIISSRLGMQQAEDGPYYTPIITYSYNVGGRDYQAKRVVIGQWSHAGNKTWTEQKVEKYPPGRSVTIYYNPNSPARAVLEPGINSQILNLWFGITVVGVFLVFVISLLLSWFL